MIKSIENWPGSTCNHPLSTRRPALLASRRRVSAPKRRHNSNDNAPRTGPPPSCGAWEGVGSVGSVPVGSVRPAARHSAARNNGMTPSLFYTLSTVNHFTLITNTTFRYHCQRGVGIEQTHHLYNGRGWLCVVARRRSRNQWTQILVARPESAMAQNPPSGVVCSAGVGDACCCLVSLIQLPVTAIGTLKVATEESNSRSLEILKNGEWVE